MGRRPDADPGDRPPALPQAAARVVLLTRAGCHLCDDALAVVERVCADEGECFATRDVDADADLRTRYGEQVPVVFVDDVPVDFWRVSQSRLRAALQGSLST